MRPSCEYVTEWWEMKQALQKIITPAVVFILFAATTLISDGASLLFGVDASSKMATIVRYIGQIFTVLAGLFFIESPRQYSRLG